MRAAYLTWKPYLGVSIEHRQMNVETTQKNVPNSSMSQKNSKPRATVTRNARYF